MAEPGTDRYSHPLGERYASREMQAIFAPMHRYGIWRRLWLALAAAQHELGLSISQQALDEMRSGLDEIDLTKAAEYEHRFRHDVMAHVHLFGDVAPAARGIIHLGATSAFVGDNTDLILHREALTLVRDRLVRCVSRLAEFAADHRDLPTLGFTHFQPGQLTTVGKRATLWLQDAILDYHDLCHHLSALRFRGAKGTTGTQASFLELFDGDSEKVVSLDRRVAKKMGFETTYPVTGQTYPRKVDSQVGDLLSRIGQSAHKFGSDLRLLQFLKEIEEPFEKDQVGSSAMAYKRNPMRSERICALSRYVITSAQSPAFTAATQWFERSLDDSANKRLSLPQMFLAIDGILILYINIVRGLVVYPKMIRRHIDQELPFLATENILMEASKRGGDRQALHERLRIHAMEAGRLVKEEGKANDLMDRIAGDDAFGMNRSELDSVLDLKAFIGRAPEQVGAGGLPPAALARRGRYRCGGWK